MLIFLGYVLVGLIISMCALYVTTKHKVNAPFFAYFKIVLTWPLFLSDCYKVYKIRKFLKALETLQNKGIVEVIEVVDPNKKEE